MDTTNLDVPFEGLRNGIALRPNLEIGRSANEAEVYFLLSILLQTIIGNLNCPGISGGAATVPFSVDVSCFGNAVWNNGSPVS